METWTRTTGGAATGSSGGTPLDGGGGGAPPEDSPFALTVEGRHGPVLDALNKAARAGGVRRGQRLTDARAICPTLAIAPVDVAAEARAHKALALWSGRWSPWTATEGRDGLLLDLTGVAHLWGGEVEAARAMLRAFADLGHRAQLGVAPTVGAAWALARYGGERLILAGPDDLASRLAPLPVDSLRLEPDTVLLLGRLGLKTVGALAGVPRLPLARRFTSTEPARNPLTRLYQALGHLPEPIAPEIAEAPARVVRRFPEPVADLPIVERLLGQMAADLARELELRGLGLRRAELASYRVDGGVEFAGVEIARPTRDPRHIARLFDGKLDRWDAGFGFDALALTAGRSEPLGAAQPGLVEAEAADGALSRLLDRLVAKLGHAWVRRPLALESHVPERSVAWVNALEESIRSPHPAKAGRRPTRLLDRPEEVSVLYATPEGAPRRFVWRKLAHNIAKAEGPERIAPEWWRERSTARLRDYYRVEDEAGRRFWIYREGLDGDGRGESPRWYLHGLFA